jgi:sulfite exporter TauE/SafE
MVEYLVLFAAGFAGSVHCAAMCGGIACAVGPDARGRTATARRQLLYNAGRLMTYVFIGGTVGALGAAAVVHGLGAWAVTAQRVLAILSGLLLIAVAAQFLGYSLPVARVGGLRIAGDGLAGAMRGLARAPGAAAPLALGVVNGFLPCPLVYAFAAKAAASASAFSGMAVMAALGLGTFPAMLLAGAAGSALTPVARRRSVTVAGVFLLLLGAITLARGLLRFGSHGVDA